jgi:hypothetical protein
MESTTRLKLEASLEACIHVAMQLLSEVPIKPLALEACDLVVLSAVIRENFAACASERGEVMTCRPSADVSGVDGVRCCGIEGGEGGGVPEGVGVDCVFEPVL